MLLNSFSEMQLSGSWWQSTLQRNRCQLTNPIGGVRATSSLFRDTACMCVIELSQNGARGFIGGHLQRGSAHGVQSVRTAEKTAIGAFVSGSSASLTRSRDWYRVELPSVWLTRGVNAYSGEMCQACASLLKACVAPGAWKIA